MPSKVSEIKKFDEYLAQEMEKRAARKVRHRSPNLVLNSLRDTFLSVGILVAFVAGYFYLTTPKGGITTKDILTRYTTEVQFARDMGILNKTPDDVTKTGEKVTVTKVIDGDTIIVQRADGNEIAVEYLGIDSPDIVDPNAPTQPELSVEAGYANVALLSSGTIYLVKDVTDRDSQGHYPRYVYLLDGTFVNYAMVRLGYATVNIAPPDISKQTLFVDAQQAAQKEKRNLWNE